MLMVVLQVFAWLVGIGLAILAFMFIGAGIVYLFQKVCSALSRPASKQEFERRFGHQGHDPEAHSRYDSAKNLVSRN